RDRQQEQHAAEGVPGAAGSTVASLNRGGPLYRIRVTLHQGRGASPSMEVLVRAGGGGGISRGTAATMPSTNSANPSAGPFRVLWRRYGLLRASERGQGS
ncbi:MAG: hypothetical protein WCA32_06980, partial [Chromatiaceae bacterium]